LIILIYLFVNVRYVVIYQNSAANQSQTPLASWSPMATTTFKQILAAQALPF